MQVHRQSFSAAATVASSWPMHDDVVWARDVKKKATVIFFFSLHVFDFNEIKEMILAAWQQKHQQQRRIQIGMVDETFNHRAVLSTNVIMNKRYHARWNIISYIYISKCIFNRLRQLFQLFPFFLRCCCCCCCCWLSTSRFCHRVAGFAFVHRSNGSLSSLFQCICVFLLRFGSFRFHLFLF